MSTVRDKLSSAGWAILLGAIVIIVFAAISVFVGGSLYEAYSLSKFSSQQLDTAKRVDLMAVIIGISVLLVAFKAFSRYAYGLAEASMGLASAWVAVSYTLGTNHIANGALLCGSIYFVSRGLSNALEGSNEAGGGLAAVYDMFRLE